MVKTAAMVLMFAGLATGVRASEPGTPSGPAAAPPPPTLAGPSVEARPATPTLVKRDFEGRIVRPEPPIEAAALKLLTLDDATRAKVDALLTERVRLIDEALISHFDLLVQAESTIKAGTPSEKAALLFNAINALGEVNAGGGLEVRVRRVLPRASRQEFDRVLGAYWDAVVDDARRGVGSTRDAMMGEADKAEAAEDDAGAKPRLGIVFGERTRMLAQEIEAAFARLTKSGGVLYAVLTRGMDLAPEQQGQVKAACAEYMERNPNGEGSPGEHLRLAGTLMPMLTDEQRQILRSNVTGGYRPAKPKKGSKTGAE